MNRSIFGLRSFVFRRRLQSIPVLGYELQVSLDIRGGNIAYKFGDRKYQNWQFKPKLDYKTLSVLWSANIVKTANNDINNEGRQY